MSIESDAKTKAAATYNAAADCYDEPASLKRLLEEGGAEAVEVESESTRHPLGTPEDWWTIALGSGYRGTLDQMGPEARERVRRANLSYLREHDVRSVEANVIYAIATKRPV